MYFVSRKLLWFGLTTLAIGGFGLTARSQFDLNAPPSHVTIAAPLSATPSIATPLSATASTANLPFEVCGESKTWVRPTRSEQIKKLQSEPRYASELASEPLQNLLQRFRQQNVFAFTQYGLSLRMEPIYFSGLWNVQDTLWQCYDSTRITQMNAGKMAEVWVLSHRVKRIQWTGEQYVMVVQPARTGVQFIQFPRRESRSTLPLKVITDRGTKLTVVAGN